jgi:hypothetical protein
MILMTNPFPDRLQKYLDKIPEFITFIAKVKKIEDNMTNRIPGDLGLVCRWIKVKQKSKEIHCDYGHGEPPGRGSCRSDATPGLIYCLQCFGCLFNSGIIEERFKEIDYFSREIRPSDTSDIESLKKFNKKIFIEIEAKLVEYLKDTLIEKIKLLNKFESGEEVDFCD